MGEDDEDTCRAVPSFFRCPISLDLMRSPVSLCTGVTYDRPSIQRWLDSGHDTCPATMQTLLSKDLVPNHTLHRLIQQWSHQTPPEPQSRTQTRTRTRNLNDTFNKFLRFAAESPENRTLLASNHSLLDLLLRVASSSESDPDLLESGLKLLKIISPNFSTVLKKSPDFLSSVSRILKSDRPDLSVAVANMLESIAPDSESKKAIFDKNEDLISELLRAADSSYSDLPNSNNNNQAVGSILRALVFLCTPRRNKLRFVREGGVAVAARVVRSEVNGGGAVEAALTLLEMAAGSGEGRAAIVEEKACVAAVVEKLMKGSKAANEHGVALLWSLCYFFRDRRAREEVVRSCNNGGGVGFMKVLLLMQSDYSPAVKKMCCDLLRIFRVNSKGSCTLSSYDTKTTHIMPC